eukprot:m.53320 g.53320  ORF g.53320 m.53320 type:complete len:84 (-) comp9150_c0_seq1:540-791(-)
MEHCLNQTHYPLVTCTPSPRICRSYHKLQHSIPPRKLKETTQTRKDSPLTDYPSSTLRMCSTVTEHGIPACGRHNHPNKDSIR